MLQRSIAVSTLVGLLAASAIPGRQAPAAGSAMHMGGSATSANVEPAPFLEQIGHLGGTVGAMFVDGSRAWVRLSTQGAFRWIVLDLEQRPELAVVAEVPDETLGRVLGVRDGLMLSAASDEAARLSPAVTLLDVSNPFAIAPVGSVGTREHAWDALWDADRVYMRVGAHLAILDVSTPSSPVLLQTELDVGVPMAREGTRLYTARQSYAFCEFPEEPCPPSSVHIVDVADPNLPIELGKVEVPWMRAEMSVGQVAGLAVKDGWVMAGLDSVAVIDARDPASAVVDHTVLADRPQRLLSHGDSVLLVEADGVRAFDLSDPANPTQTGFAPSSAPWSQVVGSAVREDELLVADLRSDVMVMELTTPDVVTEVAAYIPVHSLQSVAVRDGAAYATDNDGYFFTFAVSPPDQPVETGRVQLDSSDYRLRIAVGEDVAYVASPDTGIQVVDISDATAPRRLGVIAENIPGPRDVSLADQTLFVAAADSVYALDVTTPTQVVPLGHWTGPGSHALQIEKGLAYVAGERGLVVLDVSDPSAIRAVSAWEGSPSWGVQPFGALGVVALLEFTPNHISLTIVDVTEPLQPALLARHQFRGWSAQHLVAVGPDKLAVAHSALEVFDLQVPSDPQVLQSMPRLDAFQLASDGEDNVFAATYQGLTVFRTHPDAARGAYEHYLPRVFGGRAAP